MAGARISVEFDLAPFLRAADAIEGVADNNVEILQAEIGELLMQSHRRRFIDQKAPDGTPWAPLSPAYKAKKKQNADRVLVLHGLLAGTLRYQVGVEGLLFGTDRVYGAVHQFGAKKGQFGQGTYTTRKGSFPIPWGNIPARPYLGVSEEDKVEIAELIKDRLAAALAG